MPQAEAELPFGRPKEELSSGLGQEARDRCTGEGHQITDTLASGPHLCIWVCGGKGQAGSEAEVWEHDPQGLG